MDRFATPDRRPVFPATTTRPNVTIDGPYRRLAPGPTSVRPARGTPSQCRPVHHLGTAPQGDRRPRLVSPPRPIHSRTGNRPVARTTTRPDPPRHAGRAAAPPIRRDTAAPQPVTIASDHGERIELSFHCDEPGIVVLTDQAYPGWTASRTLDGTKQPPAHVETAWGQWRMVRIPRAGDWIVRFEFAPTSSRLGRAVSLVAIAGWLELSGFYWWTRQDKGEPIHSCDTPELQSDEAPAGGQHPPEPHRTR